MFGGENKDSGHVDVVGGVASGGGSGSDGGGGGCILRVLGGGGSVGRLSRGRQFLQSRHMGGEGVHRCGVVLVN